MVEKKLVFDFDGVLFDSVDEVILTAYRCLVSPKPSRQLTTLDDLPSSYITLFRRYRPYIQPACDILTLAKWCLTEKLSSSLSVEEWKLLVESEKESAHIRRDAFFEERAEFCKHTPDEWFKLTHPYQPLWEFFKKTSSHHFILTNKNKQAVIDLCNYYGCPIDATQIYSAETGETKFSNFLKLRHSLGKESQIVFIEDCLENLLELEQANNNSQNKQNAIDLLGNRQFLLASWGYILEQDLHRAKENNISIIQQTDIPLI